MNKSDVVEKVAKRLPHITKRDTKLIVDITFKSMANALIKGEKIEIRGFGTFKVKNLKVRKARNPKTNQEVLVPARKKTVFKVSKELNKLLN